MKKSPLEKVRAQYQPGIPRLLTVLNELHFSKGAGTSSIKDEEAIQKRFPHTYGKPLVQVEKGSRRKTTPLRVGVVLSGGQAAGGHNVITGLLDGLLALHPDSQLIGFLGGPSGVVEGKSKQLTVENVAPYRNQGGFDLIGSGRTKIETEEQLASALKTCTSLDALVVIGGDDSNTNAAVLAEYFLAQGSKTCVIGVPKTIDGDLKNDYVATSFGFDTACRTYSELIGNIARDACSAKKYTHFIKLMGRSASHIALECALQTQPNLTLIGEEIAAKKMTLAQVTAQIADLIEERSSKGLNYGVILIPEGLIEFIPEIGRLINELSRLGAEENAPDKLPAPLKQVFDSIPLDIQNQLLLDRDPHGNVQVSMIETEKLLMQTVEGELKRRSFKGKFSAQNHFFGYEGRAGLPTNFDAHYCYALGRLVALLADEHLTGYMATIGNLHLPVEEWTAAGLPITQLMNLEERKGKLKPVIQKALVDLNGKAFRTFEQQRAGWRLHDAFRYPGPIQFFGDPSLTEAPPLTLQIEAE